MADMLITGHEDDVISQITAWQSWDTLTTASRRYWALVSSGCAAAALWAGLDSGAFAATVHQARQLLAALRHRDEIPPGPRGSRCQVPALHVTRPASAGPGYRRRGRAHPAPQAPGSRQAQPRHDEKKGKD